jgi:hypothetical protein
VRRRHGSLRGPEAIRAVLASCYIPLVWEDPVMLPGRGLVVDGGASTFVVDADLVIGPPPQHNGIFVAEGGGGWDGLRTRRKYC